MKRMLSIAFTLLLAVSVAMPSIAAGPADPGRGDQKGIVAALIERALEKAEDPSEFVNNQISPVLTDDVAGPRNFQEHIVYAIMNHNPEDVPPEDSRLPVLQAVRDYIEQNTPHEKQAELFAYQYFEEHGLVEVRELADNDIFFNLVRELALYFEIISP